MQNIAFIGVGVMGRSMVRNLMKNGYQVSIYTRTKRKVLDVIEDGALWCDSIAECVQNKDAVITMVGFPKDVEEVYFGEHGIIQHAKPGAYLIDMTTTSPKLSQRIYQEASAKGLFALDAPVSGGDVGAKNATLAIMVGGEEAAFNACLPIFEVLGKTITYHGPAGSGQHTKMANQIAIAGTLAGVCEALAYGKAAGLDLEKMLATISSGAAGSWQMSNNGVQILKGNYDPGFYIKHFIKDMTIAAEESSDVQLELAVLKNVLSMYQELAKAGLEDLGTQALIKYYEK